METNQGGVPRAPRLATPLYPNGAYKGRRKLDLFSAPGVSHRLQGSFWEHGKVSKGFHTNG